jgi:uncharacterized phage infection (PIP) family protein YhgE
MKPGRILQLCALAAGAALSSAAAGNGAVTSLDQVATAFDGTGKALEKLSDASESGDLQRAKTAVTVYLRSLSSFHTKLARLRTDRQGVGFLKEVASQLNSQIGAVQTLTENAQPGVRLALNEAMNHLRSALELADQTISPRRRLSFKVLIRGPESTNPGARSWPPQGPLGITDPQSGRR